jgi:Arc/MetJ-type ribon-helix-helix transcriptional regulator
LSNLEKKEKTNWCIPVPKTLDDALETAVTLDSHSSKSEFVRDAVRRRLEEMGFKPQVFENKSQEVQTKCPKTKTPANTS